MSEYTINFYHLKCEKETNDWSASDEPFLLFLTANWNEAKKVNGEVEGLQVVASRTQWWGDVDAGESRYRTYTLWGQNTEWAPIPSLKKTLFYAALLEHDKSELDGVRSSVEGTMKSFLEQRLKAVPDINKPDDYRSLLVVDTKNRLDNAIADALDKQFWVPDKDERLGVQRLVVYRADLDAVTPSRAVTKKLTFQGDGGQYYAEFHIYGR